MDDEADVTNDIQEGMERIGRLLPKVLAPRGEFWAIEFLGGPHDGLKMVFSRNFLRGRRSVFLPVPPPEPRLLADEDLPVQVNGSSVAEYRWCTKRHKYVWTGLHDG